MPEEFKRPTSLAASIRFRLHKLEKAEIQERAARLGVSMSEYCRKILLHHVRQKSE